MSGEKIKVPEGMHRAAVDWLLLYENFKVDAFEPNTSTPEQQANGRASVVLEAALRWQSENPIVPTKKQFDDMSCLARIMVNGSSEASTLYEYALIKAFQIEAYLAPEPEKEEKMSGEKIVVPVGMLKAFRVAMDEPKDKAKESLSPVARGLKAALLWLTSRSPELPVETIAEIAQLCGISNEAAFDAIDLGMRRMFFAAKPARTLEDIQIERNEVELKIAKVRLEELLIRVYGTGNRRLDIFDRKEK